MKSLTLAFLILGNWALAQQPDTNFAADLRPLHSALLSAGPSAELVGKEFTASLTLRYATPKTLVFSDAFLVIDDKTKYQIAKWMFTPEMMEKVKDRKESRCRVKFIIREVRKEGVYEKMPHVIAEITETVEPLD